MRKPKKIVVDVAFVDGMRKWRGFDTCSPYFAIAKSQESRRGRPTRETAGWDLIHVPTGLCKKHCSTILEARLFAGIFSALSFDWGSKDLAWDEWQKKHSYLMPWFRVTGQVLVRVV